MTTNYHTPISTTLKVAATGATINAPLSELDTELTDQASRVGALETLDLGTRVGALETQVATLELLTGNQAATCGRLTLVSGKPVPDIDDIGVSSDTIYFTPYRGNLASLYKDEESLSVVRFSELSLSLDYEQGIEQGKIYDVFLVNDDGTLRIGFGPAWETTSNRGSGAGKTELTLKHGIYVNKQEMYLTCGATHIDVEVSAFHATYLGSFLATDGGQGSPTGDGKTRNDEAQGFLYNAYNRVAQLTQIALEENDHAYTSTAYRNWGGDDQSLVSLLLGLEEDAIDVAFRARAGKFTAVGVTVVGANTIVVTGQYTNIFGETATGAMKTYPVLGRVDIVGREAGLADGGEFYDYYMQASVPR